MCGKDPLGTKSPSLGPLEAGTKAQKYPSQDRLRGRGLMHMYGKVTGVEEHMTPELGTGARYQPTCLLSLS